MRLLSFIIIFVSSISHAALDCGGTEPFWSADVSSKEIVHSLYGLDTKTKLAVSNLSAPTGMPSSEIGFIRILSDKRGPLAVITRNKCSDGMSDEVYPHEIILFTNGHTYYGCCRKGKLSD